MLWRKTSLGISIKEKYGFDLDFERQRYISFSCGNKSRKCRKLNNLLKFECYSEWKEYVWNKYKEYDKNILMDFSRYLKQKIRNEKLFHEFWNLFIPILLTLTFTNILEEMIELYSVDLQGMPAVWVIPLYFIISICIVGSIVWIVWKFLQSLTDTCIDESFFSDYKEVIDEIIRKKQKREKKRGKK